MRNRTAVAVSLVLLLGLGGPGVSTAGAQAPDVVLINGRAPDVVLINGRIVTLDQRSSIQQGLAVRDGKVIALGDTAGLRKSAGPATRVIDLQGHTVIPGLIDSHLHAIRAALSFSTEVNWIGAPSLTDAMRRISEAAKRRPGAWVIVAGGWNEQQF